MQPSDSLQSLRDYVRWGVSQFNQAGVFFGHGTDNALDEALQLVLHALHLDYQLPDNYLDCRLTQAEAQSIEALFARRINERLPAAYLTGKALFAGYEFKVNSHVLVPRSPFAELIQSQFKPWLDATQIESALDLCTGSGCIGLAMSLHFLQLQVDAVDISAEALAVARENLHNYGLQDQVRLYQGDLFSALESQSHYDLIVSNPPYVSEAEYQSLPEEYQNEPKLGLECADDGLSVVIRILQQASNWLKADGHLIVEVGFSAEALQQRYPDAPFIWIEFQQGGEGIFLLSRTDLLEYKF